MSSVIKRVMSVWGIIFIFILLFVVIRTVYFSQLFRFIYDQVSSSTVALELWKNKDITLIGPPMSLTIGNRQIFFGGVSYYIQLAFLLIGTFDPFWSTYAFMIFSGLMMIPLYYGVKKLISKKAAIVMCLIYTFLPFYIEGTVYLWNPYFQLALSPVLMYLLARFNEKKTLTLAFGIGFLSGILFQLHYQFLIVLIGLTVYFLVSLKLHLKFLIVICIGFIAGIGNLILFELRNNFYLTQTLFLFFKSSSKIAKHPMSDYYAMTILFFGLLIMLHYFKERLSARIITSTGFILILLGIHYAYITAPKRNFPPGWYYKNEKQVYDIIKQNYAKGILHFNVFAFYDATGTMQKYFLKRDNYNINYEDYYNNQYLYVMYEDETFINNPAYEVNTFVPSKLIKRWKINDRYNLYLLERLYDE